MNVKEFYQYIGEDYFEMLNRFHSDEKIKKYLLMFKGDTTFLELIQGISSKDHELSFRSVHTLKGVSINLGFKKLYEVSSTLTELLRNKDYIIDETTPINDVIDEYNKIISPLERLD